MYKVNYRGVMGFTLIEVMIVVVIIGILASIAYPNYTAFVERGKRSEGRAMLAAAANRMERFYSDCNIYPTTIGTDNNCGTSTVSTDTTSESGYYTLSITSTGTNQQSFTIQAAPAGWTDADCGNLTLRSDGTRGRSGTGKTEAECWGK